MTASQVPPAPVPRFVKVGLGVGLAGAALWFVRWLIQGEATIWSDLARRFWVRDPAIGWVETSERWPWLGLDGLILTVMLVGGAALFALVTRRASERWRRILGPVSLLGAAVVCLGPVLPVLAFVSGMPPAGSEILLPTAPDAARAADAGEVQPALPPLPVSAGAWVVADDPRANLLAVRTAAGGETFDTTFGPMTGTATFDPAAPAATKLMVSAPSASLATGIELRDDHARGFLKVTEHPAITLTLVAFEGPFQAAPAGTGPDAVAWSGRVTLGLMGAQIPALAHGTLVARKDKTLLVQGSFDLPLSATRLTRSDFDQDKLVVTARFVLRSR